MLLISQTKGSSSLTGFDYNFNAIEDESNELFNAYKDMFEIGISQGSWVSTFITIYAPWISKIFVGIPVRSWGEP